MKIGNVNITEQQANDFLDLLRLHIMSAQTHNNSQAERISKLLNGVEIDDGKSNACDIITFSFTEQTGEAVIDNENNTITIEVSFNSELNALSPVITLSDGATVAPASESEEDFTNPVNYVVTAEDGHATKTYEVTVTKEISVEAKITGFTLTAQTGEAIIDDTAGTILIEVENGTVISSLEPVVTISKYATVVPASGAATDFTNPVVYTVTAEDGVTEKEYTVTVTEAQA